VVSLRVYFSLTCFIIFSLKRDYGKNVVLTLWSSLNYIQYNTSLMNRVYCNWHLCIWQIDIFIWSNLHCIQGTHFISYEIKSLLLSHHHSTSALVSGILTSVLQTVQKTTIYIWTVHIYRLYRRQCAKYTYIYSVHIVYYKDILNYQLHIIHRMGTSTLCTLSIHYVVYT